MKINNSGYVTVVASLLVCVMMIFIMFILEWIYVYTGTAKVAVATTANMNGMFGNYHAGLFQDYHLLMLDKTFGTGSEASMEAALQAQLAYSITTKKQAFSYRVEDVVLADVNQVLEEDFASLKEQIHAYSGYAMADTWLAHLKNRAEGVEGKEEVPQQDKAALPENFQDPRNFYKDLTGKLLLRIVCPEENFPSDKEIELSSLPSNQAGVKADSKENDIDFFYDRGVAALLNRPAFDWAGLSSTTENLELAFYVADCFQNACGKEFERTCVLKNEQEYILYGGKSDQENLIDAVKGIILLRFPFNYACLKKDLVKQGIITTAAMVLAVAGKTSVPLMTSVLNGAICYGEGMLDVKALLEGEAVPLVKNAKDWRLDVSSFLLQKVKGKANGNVKKGLLYQDYLTILMLLKPNKTKLYYRILDVITLNIRQKESGFAFANMITKATVQYRISLVPKFSKMLQRRNAGLYTIYETRTLAY